MRGGVGTRRLVLLRRKDLMLEDRGAVRVDLQDEFLKHLEDTM